MKCSFEAGSDWKTRAEDNLFALKKNLHAVLNSAAVQNFQSTCKALRARVPYSFEPVQQPQQEDQNAGNAQCVPAFAMWCLDVEYRLLHECAIASICWG